MTVSKTVPDFTKVCRIGSTPRSGSVFVKIAYTAGKLSLTGVEGPLANGDAKGSCGQIDMHPWDIDQYAEGWSAETEAQLRHVWKEWHLNDMQAGCVHQRAEKWGDEKIELVTYSLSSEGHRLRREAEAEATKAALEGRTANLTDTGRFLIGPDWFKDRHEAPDADSPLSGCFEVKKREQKYAGHVYENQHPRGVLCKVCPTCGYKYGSAWLKQEVPAEVLAWLQKLPDADRKPAWC